MLSKLELKKLIMYKNDFEMSHVCNPVTINPELNRDTIPFVRLNPLIDMNVWLPY